MILQHKAHAQPLFSSTHAAGRRRLFGLFVLLLWMFASGAKAQSVPQQPAFRFRHITIEHGLSQNSVNCALQDKMGFMWFGTQDGLNRFDGSSILVYRHDSFDTNSVASSYIQTLYEDRAGTIWVGTRGGGLCSFDPRANRFAARSAATTAVRALGGTDVFAILEDRAGMLWVGTNNGLFRLDRSRQQAQIFQYNAETRQSLPSNVVCCLLETPQGIWIGTNNGLCILTHTNNTASTTITRCTDKQLPRSIRALAALDEQTLLVAGEGGIQKLDTRTNAAMGTFGLPADVAQTLRKDRTGAWWIGTAERGVQRVWQPSAAQANTANSSIICCTNNPNDNESLSGKNILSVYEDRAGGIWIGSDGAGANYFHPAEHKFLPIRIPASAQAASLTNPQSAIVLSVVEDKNGIIWTGTFGDGFIGYNPRTGSFTSYKANSSSSNNAISSETFSSKTVSNNYIWSLCEDRAGALWIGTQGGGVNRFDRASGRFTVFMHNPTKPNSLPDNAVFSVFEDKQGVLWVSSNGGLSRFNPATQDFTTYRNIAGNPRSLSMNAVRQIYEDRAGMLWVGTRGGGVNRFDRTNGTFTTFRNDPNDPKSLSNDVVLHINEDAAGALWIATFNGLNRFDRATNSFTPFRKNDGLPASVVCSVLGDNRGNLWLGTTGGLSKFHPQTKTIETFTTDDGTQSNEFNQATCFKNASGVMYFGGIRGLNRFHPDSLVYSTFDAPLVFTGFKKFNKDAALDSSFAITRELHLSHEDSFFSIEFALLNYTLPHKSRYFYKLDGFDKDWVEAGASRVASYTNLDGGKYTLRVRAKNFEGRWSSTEATLQIVIHPPWWQLRSVRAVLALVIASLVFWMYRWRVRRVERRNTELEQAIAERTAELKARNEEITRQNAQLKQLNNEKNEFLGIAAHDLKNPLSSIMMAASLVKEYGDQMSKQEVAEQMTQVQLTSKRMRDLITNLLDVNALESEGLTLARRMLNIVELAHRTIEESTLSAASKGIVIYFSPAAPVIAAFGDDHAVCEVFDNLLSNAVKYSPAGKRIWVTVCVEGNEVIFSVRDEGPGLSEQDKERLFQRFARLSANPTAGEHSTGLGLSIVKKLVDMMNGRVWCDSSRESGIAGATFTVALPQVPANATASHEDSSTKSQLSA